jgi:hypothetical protein
MSDSGFGSPDGTPDWLFGRWRLLRADPELDFTPGVRMDFRPGGHLMYTLPLEGREYDVALIYRVEGETLRTDNPSAPHATSTRFTLGAGGVLHLDFAGASAWFVRES